MSWSIALIFFLVFQLFFWSNCDTSALLPLRTQSPSGDCMFILSLSANHLLKNFKMLAVFYTTQSYLQGKLSLLFLMQYICKYFFSSLCFTAASSSEESVHMSSPVGQSIFPEDLQPLPFPMTFSRKVFEFNCLYCRMEWLLDYFTNSPRQF